MQNAPPAIQLIPPTVPRAPAAQSRGFLTQLQKGRADQLVQSLGIGRRNAELLGIARDAQKISNRRLARDDPTLFIKQLDLIEDIAMRNASRKGVEIFNRAKRSGFAEDEARIIGRKAFELQKEIEEIGKTISIGRSEALEAMQRFNNQVQLPAALSVDNVQRQSALGQQA